MNEQSNQYLSTTPIGQLMFRFSVPCILSLLVSSLYNIVDQIFIGHAVGYLGNGATNVVFPITVIALAASLMIGDGCAAYLSLCQGRQDRESSHKSVGNSIVLFAGISILFVALFCFGREGILSVFGATENNITYARDYFNIIVIGIPFYIFTNGINSIIRADGSPQYAMFSTLVGCVLNVILDPVALFVLHWGVKGAALATIFGQIVSAFLGFAYLFHTKSFRLSRQSFRLSGNIIKHVLPLGISSLLTQLSIVVIMGVMNSTLVRYGALSKYGADIPMTVVGIVMKVFQIVIAFVVGIAAGCQPIIGYNYGAGNVDRVKKIYQYMIRAEIVIGLIATLAVELFPMHIIQIFGSESDLYNEFAVYAFRIYLSTMLFCCIQKATSIFLQAIGKPVMSMLLSLLRDFVLNAAFVLILPHVFHLGVMGPLFSAPIADVLSFLAAMVMVGVIFRQMDRQMPSKETATRHLQKKTPAMDM